MSEQTVNKVPGYVTVKTARVEVTSGRFRATGAASVTPTTKLPTDSTVVNTDKGD